MASQFGAAKNPPWARPPADFINANPATSITQNQLTQAQQLGNTIMVPGSLGNPTVYSLGSNNPSLGTPQYNAALNAVGLQPQQATTALPPPQAVLPQPGIATPTSLASHQVPTVSYPAPRASQPTALPQGIKQRVFTGTVTKLHDTFGFVDEEVFFQMTSVKGAQPKVGERVLVEAAYNASMPFKWNATRIQLLPGQQPTGVNAQTTMKGNVPMGQILHSSVNTNTQPPQMSMNAVPPPPLMSHGSNEYRNTALPNQGSSSRISMNQPSVHRSEPGRFSSAKEREKHVDRERERERRDRERIRDSRRKRSPPRRSRSPVRSPPRKRAPRSTPRYTVQIPKLSLNLRNANVVMLKTRYSNMYIPSDFFYTNLRWNDAFPLERPFKLGNNCNFHIMDKDVEPVTPNTAALDPSDADHSYIAKVMLLSSASLEDLYHKSCGLAEDSPDLQENFQHPTRLLQFLVGVRGKNEPMAIGGPWSASLDGPNPAGDPQVLINTAIRTTKALTGIDLSSCTKWYRFAEICYLRPAGSHKGRQLDDRVETVVIYMPDVWMCTPSRLEWEQLQSAYSNQLQTKLASSLDSKDPGTQEEEEMETETSGEKKEPVHFSELDPKTMKIIDLRQELEARNLSAKGLKSQLIARLTKALKGEQEAEEEEMKQEQEKEKEKASDSELLEATAKEEAAKKEEEEQKKKDKKEKAVLEKKYSMPETPSLLVHPHPTAKSGKFDCAVMSLSVLLDYRPEDNKEHIFEVSLFAEMFNEMLMRDFGFQIYLGLLKAPAKKDDKDDKKDKEDSKKDEKKDKDEQKVKEEKKDEEKKEKDDKEVKKEDKDGEKGKEEIKTEEVEEDEHPTEKEDDTKKDKEKKEKKRDKRKMTTDPALLLSFVYYDLNHTGYLLDKDLEEILTTIGLQLSRAQIKKIVTRVVSRDSFNYRKITDSIEGERKDLNQIDEAGTTRLAHGNTTLLKSSQNCVKSVDDVKDGESETSTSSIIQYKGSMINIESLLDKLEKGENNRMSMEKMMQDMETEIGTMKESLKETEQRKLNLISELKNAKDEISQMKVSHAHLENQNKKYHQVLVSSQDTLTQTLSAITTCLAEERNPVETLNTIPIKAEPVSE